MRQSKFIEKLTYNWQIKIMALVAAICIYFAVTFLTLGERRLAIPVDVELPEGMTAVSNVPESVEIVITGDADLVYLVDPSRIEASLDFSHTREAGIATAPVVLNLGDGIFDLSAISISAEPSYYRIMFEGSAQ